MCLFCDELLMSAVNENPNWEQENRHAGTNGGIMQLSPLLRLLDFNSLSLIEI